MSKKQIDEMAKVLIDYTKKKNIMASYIILEDYAEELYNAGYRKATEVVEDVFSDFESILFSLMYLDFDGKYHLRKMNGDRVTKIFERYYNIKKKYTEGEK